MLLVTLSAILNILQLNRVPMSRGKPQTKTDGVLHGKLIAHNSSGVRGVSWHLGRGKWIVRVQRDGKTVTIDYYDTIEEAKLARQKAIDEIYGERRTAEPTA